MIEDPLGHTQLQDNVERAKRLFNGSNSPVVQLCDSLLQSTENDSNTPTQAVENYNRIHKTGLRLKEILICDKAESPPFADHYSVDLIGKHTVKLPVNGAGSITTGMLFGDTEIHCRSVNELGQEVVTNLMLT
ncbi:hypothetical protein BC938DRAFT_474756 [Jimgerdemannia flammicorona]|uniref:Uncharacterized protein n=1 Tax=Jimgerdemannia flammicorona TaxID=994334 RepID=A0A433QS85_9FUNG|nr:hypothetical protein BC938DRAFT_474756 [Jimgerdemannia flammicorona]